MEVDSHELSALSNDALLSRAVALASHDRRITAQLIACLAEVDSRNLHLSLGYSSLFAFCTQRLHLTEHAAYGRIEAARVVKRFPLVLAKLEAGDVSLTAVTLLARHLTEVNHRRVLEQAAHATRTDVERLVAQLQPVQGATSTLRKQSSLKPVVVSRTSTRGGPLLTALASGAADSSILDAGLSLAAPAVSPAADAVPATEERYSLRVTISTTAHSELMRARDLLRHAVPSGDLGLVLERAVSSLLCDLEARKLVLVTRPRAAGKRQARTDTRYIPASVRREVWRRDGARCAFIGPAGRCVERGFLELHHVLPFAEGGQATAPNIELRCRAHNAHEAQVYFGGTRAP